MELTPKQAVEIYDAIIDDRYNGTIQIETPFGIYTFTASEVLKAVAPSSYESDLFAYLREARASLVEG